MRRTRTPSRSVGYARFALAASTDSSSSAAASWNTAWDAVAACRQRCRKSDWIVDLDIRSFFDSVPSELVVKPVLAHSTDPWVLLYVKRWLAAPLQLPDGTLRERDRGTPQGSAVSPVLANLFLHYAFDAWMAGRSRPSSSSVTPTM